jgi:hypothetical protein
MDETKYSSERGHPVLREVEDGTEIRYKYTRGQYSGEVAKAEIKEGHVIYNGKKYSPSGAARAAMRDIRGSDYEQNGWKWWKYYDDEAGDWKDLESLK